MKYTHIKLRPLLDKNLILTLENNIRGGIGSIMDDRYVQSDDYKKILYVVAFNLYGWAMSECLPYDETKFDGIVKFEEFLNTPHDSDIGYFVQIDLIYPDNIKQKTKNFPFAPVDKKTNPDDFSDYLNKILPDTYTQTKRLISDWSDQNNFLIPSRMLKFYVIHGVRVERVLNVISFNQSKWLRKYINFITQKRNKARKKFEKDFYKLLNNSFYGKTMENVRNRTRVEFIRKDYSDNFTKQQSKSTFKGIHKSYENYDKYTFKQNDVLLD